MNAILRAVRRLATLPLVRRLTKVTPLTRISFALRATLVRERGRFVRNELRTTAVTATYRLRESNLVVALRHHGGDVMVLDELFSQQEYELPRPVEEALAAATEPLDVVDLGANIGLFGAWLLGRYPTARIVGLEADPSNAAVHRLTIDANGLGERWRLVEAFAGIRSGTTHLASGRYGLSRVSNDDQGIVVPVVDVLPELRNADLVKIDIEGAEWPILSDDRFRGLRATAVVLEYHAWGCPAGDPRALAEQMLGNAGYQLIHTGEKPAFGAGVLWGWRG